VLRAEKGIGTKLELEKNLGTVYEEVNVLEI
jgi:hypothetical protein